MTDRIETIARYDDNGIEYINRIYMQIIDYTQMKRQATANNDKRMAIVCDDMIRNRLIDINLFCNQWQLNEPRVRG